MAMMTRMARSVPGRGRYDAIVVGGGFFGCSLATYLARRGDRVVLLEKDNDYLKRSSYANQARVHNGYHYPRHFLTAVRSRVNFPRFVSDYSDCVVSSFDKYYAVASKFSKTTAKQFFNFMSRVGSPISEAPSSVTRLFNGDLIEGVFKVQEYAFDALKLKEQSVREMMKAGVEACLGVEALSVHQDGGEIQLRWSASAGDSGHLTARAVFNCTYSSINQLLHRSGLDLIRLKHELTEMALIDLPAELEGKSVTVMCGPFFSFMPFPPLGFNTLSHVRYTPHCHWYDERDAYFSGLEWFDRAEKRSQYPAMIRDAARYIPSLQGARYRGSLWEIKTTLPASEHDDGRPILFKRDVGLAGLTCVMGGKIDNIYDALLELEKCKQ